MRKPYLQQLICTILFLLVVSVSAFSQGFNTTNWKFSNPKQFGFTVLDVDYFDNNNVIAVGDQGGIARSTDGGRNWTYGVFTYLTPAGLLSKTTFNDVHFVTSTVAYAVGNNGVMAKTTDGGTTWSFVNNPLFPNQKPINACWFINANKGYIGGDYNNTPDSLPKLYVTLNGGASWDSIAAPPVNGVSRVGYINNPLIPSVLAPVDAKLKSIYRIEFINDTTGYICGSNSYGVTLFPNVSFRATSTTVCTPLTTFLTSGSMAASLVWKFKSGVLTDYSISKERIGYTGINTNTINCTSAYATVSPVTQQYRAMNIINDSTVVLMSFNNNTVVKINTGKNDSTANVNAPGVFEKGKYQVLNFPSPPTQGPNAGPSIPPVQVLLASNPYQMRRTANGTLLVAGNGGRMYKSVDTGRNWIPDISLPAGQNFSNDGVWGFDIAPNGRIISMGQSGVVADSLPGSSWFSNYLAIPHDGGYNDMEFTDCNNGIAAGGSAITVTTDGGKTWIDRNSPVLAALFANITHLAYVSPTKVYFTTSIGNIYRSANQAQNLSPVFSDPNTGQINDIAWQGSDSLWACGFSSTSLPAASRFGMVYRSFNNAATWDTIKVGPIGTNSITWRAIDFPTKLVGYVCGSKNAVYKTTDAGATWTDISPFPALTPQITYTAIQSLNKDTIFVVGVGFPRKVVYRTTDGGASWTDITSNILALGVGNLNGILMHDINNGYVMTPGGALLITNNGGTSWTLDLAPTSNLFTTAAFVPRTVGPGVNMSNRKMLVTGPNLPNAGAPILEYGNPANTQVNSTELITGASCTSPNGGSITITATGGLAPYTYQLNTGPFQSSNVFTGLAAGTYTITIKDAYCGLLTKTVTVGFTDNLVLNLSNNDTTVCTGASVQLNASGNAATYSWSPATGLSNPNIPNPVATVTTTTTYTVTATLNGCVKTKSVTISVYPNLPLAIVADPGTVLCQGDPTKLTVSEPSGPSTPATVTSTFTSGNGNFVITFNFRNNNGFPVTITDIASLAYAAGASNVQAWYSTTSISGSPGAITAPTWNQFGSGTITAIGGTTVQPFMSGLSLTVQPGQTIRILVSCATVANGFNMGYATIAAGTYTFSNNGCDIVTGTNIGYGGGAIPAVPANTPRGFIGSVTFSVPGLAPVTTGSFLWSPAAGLSSTTTNPVAASPSVTTTYTVTHTSNPGGCIRTGNITITVNTRPAVTAQPANTAVCAGGTATFTANGTATGVAYQWQESTDGGVSWNNLSNAAPYSNVTTTTLTINPVTITMNGYRYRLAVSGTCPPVANSNAAILTVNPLPNVTVTPTSGCGGVPGINGLALTASGANTYTWAPFGGLYTNATATVPYGGGNAATVYAAPAAMTMYTVTGTLTATGCSNTASALINYTPPAPTVTPSSVTMCLGDPAVKLKSSTSQSFTNTFCSGTVNVSIPDGPTIPPVPVSYPASTSSISVTGIPANATVTGLRVKMNITHNYVGDLVIVLKAPNGNVFNLDAMLNKTNNAGANFTNTVIGSAGTTLLSAGTAPFTATFKADGAGATFTAFGFTFPGGPTGYIPNTAAFSGLYSVPNGSWTLAMYDAGAPDAGVLNNWCLDVDYVIGVPATPATWSPAAGLFSDANATVPYVAGTAVDSVWTRPTPEGVYNYQATVQSLPPANAAPSTPMAGGNGNNMVFFNITNNNGYPMTLTGISTNTFGSGAVTARAFYKTSAIAGNPGLINAGNGWNQTGGSINSNVTAGALNPVLTGLSLSIPAGATYGIGLELSGATFPAYTNGTGTIATYTDNGVTITTDGNVGWGGPVAPGPPANNPRNFNGTVYLSPAGVSACTSPAKTVTVTVNKVASVPAGSQPVNQTVCTDKVATFSIGAVSGTGPFSYQWQVSTNGGASYSAVSNTGVYNGANSTSLTITQPPVSMNGYLYRCVVQGAAPCAAASSNAAVLKVNPLPTVVLSASPFTRLFPGLTTTITATVSPFAVATNGYSWKRNGSPVPGSSNSGSLLLDVDKLGDYQLTVTDINGCVNSSNVLTIADSVSNALWIYPNPNNGVFQVRYYSAMGNSLPRGLNVYDAKGARIFTQSYSINAPYGRMDVDMRNFSKGIYWVELTDRNNNRLAVGRVVIQ
ncbi:MAG: YCF48-related protein [Ferruginibacter sp.]